MMSYPPYKIDKSRLPEGPWMHEEDCYLWADIDTGYESRIVRYEHGALCGYVAVDKTHPLYKQNYCAIQEKIHLDERSITYAAHHTPRNHTDSENLWWIGFDALGRNDLMPLMFSLYVPDLEVTYKTAAYMYRQCQKLARQLREIEVQHESR